MAITTSVIRSEEAKMAIGGDQFLLILMASERAREIAKGADPMVPVNGEKAGSIAIREIEEGLYTEAQYYESQEVA